VVDKKETIKIDSEEVVEEDTIEEDEAGITKT
jgi:hypothetical protein